MDGIEFGFDIGASCILLLWEGGGSLEQVCALPVIKYAAPGKCSNVFGNYPLFPWQVGTDDDRGHGCCKIVLLEVHEEVE